MDKDPVRDFRLARGRTGRHTWKRPDPVYHKGVKSVYISMQPAPQSWRKGIPPQKALPQSMNTAGHICQVGRVRLVKANHFDFNPHLDIRLDQLTHCLRWAASVRSKAANNVKNIQQSPPFRRIIRNDPDFG